MVPTFKCSFSLENLQNFLTADCKIVFEKRDLKLLVNISPKI